AAKASIRDVGKAMELPTLDIDRIAKLIPTSPKITIQEAMDQTPELKALFDSDLLAREVIEAAQKVEGVARHASTHAAGVVISREDLVNTVPLQRAGGKSEGGVTTQYPMGQLEAIGLLKMDFLGLSTLTILEKAVANAQPKEPDLTVATIPLEDPIIYEMLRRGETSGVFQLEGDMTTRMTINTQPDKFEDLIALMALIRPGPMELAPDYISRKRGETEVAYVHPDLEGILAETYGVALYQEQIIQIANQIAGLSMGESDEIRKAMGKKDADVMAKVKGRFVEGCLRRSVDPQITNNIWAMIERFAGYGFNKAHSAAYAVIAAQTGYMRAKYPVEFMAALLSVDIGTSEKVVSDLAECRRIGIKVLPPDINRSVRDFSVTTDDKGQEAVLFGLGAVRNVGDGAIASILASRDAQPGGVFASLDALCGAIDWDGVTRRVVESLAKAGALDVFGHRGAVLHNLERAMAAGQSRAKAKSRGQIDLFGGDSAPEELNTSGPLQGPQLDQMELLAFEKEAIGIYLSSHPLAAAMGPKLPPGHYEIVQLGDRAAGSQVKIICSIRAVRRIQTRQNKSMAVVELEDLTGRIDMVLYPDVFETFGALLEPDQILTVCARTDYRNDQLQLIGERVLTDIERVEPPVPTRTIILSPPRKRDFWEDVEVLQRLDAVLNEHHDLAAHDSIELHITVNGTARKVRNRKHQVEWTEELAAAVAAETGIIDFQILEMTSVAS
ncbi:MAG TPA: DNA polymerase III subunit alpha, partial [Thermomicrobiales bacterium]|nr:DNA polymerase III subunit alpha [Thermomicrobiales bacterium]